MLSPRGREALAPETFRPWMALRTVVMGAATLWLAVFLALMAMQGATRSSFLSAAFFVLLFSACSLFYNRLAFIVSDTGLTIRTFAMERTVPFDAIMRVDVQPGLIGTSYAVRTRAGSLTFSSLLAGHQRLCDLIVHRARLC
ncbi:MAG: PH domain-containing protein [Myxococcales bacterium]